MSAILTKTGVKIGSKGKVANTAAKMGELLGGLSKGEARKVRKLAAAGGFKNLAAAPRLVLAEVEKIAA